MKNAQECDSNHESHHNFATLLLATRGESVEALLAHARGEEAKHRYQLELLLTNRESVGAGAWFNACEDELAAIAEYREQVAILEAL